MLHTIFELRDRAKLVADNVDNSADNLNKFIKEAAIFLAEEALENINDLESSAITFTIAGMQLSQAPNDTVKVTGTAMLYAANILFNS
jgi:hypothetical protein